ncbi:biotin--[acetyl-CoA-carboxylase] ligase [Corynebacterium sp. ES2794-CONJ1]|uniref:biotin--[acetyl-CoA-carboxylase] ligase n=1 Tax=Corynebacterium sp. ES2794-CONJ1 TaxID=2980553 RepID=UPI0021DB140E|nr:biotin--[acetyl-CoA-carboxylase] ligase [Corynebacterium sp. ES2794-CONJ1]MCU9518805.1 biotin--[acetyl-CoA-carboxylase] ligase [Corynebacterium sp. ES2794-CONJ1]
MNAPDLFSLRNPYNLGYLEEKLVRTGVIPSLIYRAKTGSTNTDLVELAKQGAPSGTVCLTDHQSAGRGRMGRSYEAPYGAQLTASILIRPHRAAIERLGVMPLAVGVALCDALAWPGVRLKWPNDLIIEDGEISSEDNGAGVSAPGSTDDSALACSKRGGAARSEDIAQRLRAGAAAIPVSSYGGARKLCGILAEAVSLGKEPAVVIGFGLNTAMRRSELPVEHATSLALESIPFDRDDLAVKVIRALVRRLEQWECGDEKLLADYRSLSATIGRDIRAIVPGDREILGVVRSIAADGQLVVDDGVGTHHHLAAGDVTHLRLRE